MLEIFRKFNFRKRAESYDSRKATFMQLFSRTTELISHIYLRAPCSYFTHLDFTDQDFAKLFQRLNEKYSLTTKIIK